MLEERRAIDARARQIVAESGVLWAVARDQAKAEDARARRIVEESGVPWAVAADQAKTEVGAQSVQDSSSVEQSASAGDRSRRGAAVGGCVAVLVVVVGAVGLILASLLFSLLFSDDAGNVRDQYTDFARPGLVIASDTLSGLGLDVVPADELPTTSQLIRSDGSGGYIVPLGIVSLEPIDGEYYRAMEAVGESVSTAGYGSMREAAENHTHRSIRLHGGSLSSWSLQMVATDLAWDGDHLEAQWLEVYAYGQVLGAFQTS